MRGPLEVAQMRSLLGKSIRLAIGSENAFLAITDQSLTDIDPMKSCFPTSTPLLRRIAYAVTTWK